MVVGNGVQVTPKLKLTATPDDSFIIKFCLEAMLKGRPVLYFG